MNFRDHTASIPDFPQEGVLFHSVTPLMANGKVFKEACDKVIDFAEFVEASIAVGPESRGFILNCPVVYRLGIGFVPVHRPGELSGETVSMSYDSECGSSELCAHRSGIGKGQRVLIADDLLATGNTADAAIQTVQGLDGEVAGYASLIELAGLKDQEHLKDLSVFSSMSYE